MIKKSTTYLIIFLTLLFLFGCNGKPPEPEKVTVEICYESNTSLDVYALDYRLANEYCRKAGTTQFREYIKGTEPTEVCQIHKKPEPPPPPPPPKTKLSEDLTYHKLGKIYSAFFLKGGLCLKPDHEHYTEEDFKAVIDYIAEHDLSNVIRVFFWMNFGWEANANEIVMPHPLVNGRYDLHTINPLWESQVFRRLDYMVERRLTVRLIINDGCGIRGWHSHWLDGENNWGWRDKNGELKPTYRDKYGWTNWVHLQDPNYGNPDERARYAATRDYLLFMYDWIFTRLEKYKPYIIIDNNEVESYATWHNMMADICNDYGYTRKYMITSTMANDYMSKGGIYDRWIPEFHGIDSVAKYEDIKQWVPDGWSLIPCADGKGEKWVDMGKVEAVRLLRKSLADGNLGFQGNSEGVWSNMNPKIYEIGAVMRDEVRK